MTITSSATHLDLPEPAHDVLEQAAQWFAVLSSGEATEGERSQWHAWLSESLEHQQAWSHVESISQRFEPIKTSPERQAAITAYQQASGTLLRRRQGLLGIAALAGSGLLSWAVWRHTPLPGMVIAWSADHHTGIGEVRQIVMPDGTRVWLNALSALDQRYTPDQRRLRLLKGEILVDTARDPQQRPFYVDTAQGRLRAIGTRFAVRLGDTDTYLAVYDGSVEICTAVSGSITVIRAGEQTRFTETALEPVQPADPAREAWTRGLLVARDIPLSEVVDELRRHYHGHLGLSPEVAGLRVSGGYPVSDPDRTLAMLQSVLPIRVRRTLPWWVSIEPQESTAR